MYRNGVKIYIGVSFPYNNGMKIYRNRVKIYIGV
jgi:hypothetical protein